jgi:hypothetical protein
MVSLSIVNLAYYDYGKDKVGRDREIENAEGKKNYEIIRSNSFKNKSDTDEIYKNSRSPMDKIINNIGNLNVNLNRSVKTSTNKDHLNKRLNILYSSN